MFDNPHNWTSLTYLIFDCRFSGLPEKLKKITKTFQGCISRTTRTAIKNKVPLDLPHYVRYRIFWIFWELSKTLIFDPHM